MPPPSAVDGVDVAALHRWLDARRRQLVDDLVAYAELETPSDDLALLAKGLAHVEEWLAERLGPPADRARHESGEHGDVVVLEYAGAGDRPLTLLAHYDTVWSAGTLDGWPVRVDGDRVSGPGVFDMKAGLVQAVWAVRALRAAGVPHPPLRLLLNGDEEIGSPFSRPLIEQACADAAAVLVFEASADGAREDRAQGGRASSRWTRAGSSRTRASTRSPAPAPSTRSPGSCCSCTRPPTRRRAPPSTSVCCAAAPARTSSRAPRGPTSTSGCVRSRRRSTSTSCCAGWRPTIPRAEVTVRGGWNRPVMEPNAAIASVFALARRAAEQLGFELRETSVGGASDGNFAAAMGLPVLDGLGAVGGGAHARHEHVTVDGHGRAGGRRRRGDRRVPVGPFRGATARRRTPSRGAGARHGWVARRTACGTRG